MGTLPSFQRESYTPPATKGMKFNAPNPAPLANALRTVFQQFAKRVGVKAVPDLKTKAFLPFAEWTQEVAGAVSPVLAMYYEAGANEVRAALGGDTTLTVPNLPAAVKKAAFALADSTLRTTELAVSDAIEATRKAVEEGLSRGKANAQLADRIGEIFTDLSDRRAMLIAETEASRAKTAGELMEVRESGVDAKKVWLADGMACDQCAPLNGQVKALDEPFHVDAKGGPYAVTDHPPAHPGCRCSQTYELGEG